MRLEIASGRFYLGRDYSEAVEAAGGVPVHLSLIPKSDYISAALAGLDGVLLPGSNTDVDPHLYGEEPHPRLGTVISEKDKTDMLVLEQIEEMNLPLLAICYGMQALNVARGGALIQDIESQTENSIKHEQGVPHSRHSHSITVSEGSVLSKLNAVSEAEIIRVNSSHHQAVARLGSDLVPVAWAKDGIVESIQDTRDDRFVLGVQWHPEMTLGIDSLSNQIFERFVQECVARRSGSRNMAGMSA
jgi:putative glutamine amidotransferase